jgi:hypothetical protein
VHIGQRLLRPIPPAERLKECPTSHFHHTTSDETLEIMEDVNPFWSASKYFTKSGRLAAKLFVDSLRIFIPLSIFDQTSSY